MEDLAASMEEEVAAAAAAAAVPAVEDATAAMDLSGDHQEEQEADDGKDEENDDDLPQAVAVAANERDGEEEEPPSPPALEDKMSTTSSTDSSEEPDEAGISPEKAELILIKAAGLKEEGNQEFKDGELDKAARSYRRGVAALKKLNRNNTGDDQVKALLVTLHTNLSTVMFKNGKYRASAEVAGRAVRIDGGNVKALYRRAAANRRLGDLEGARADLRAALAADAGSAACRRELAAVRRELELARESQKRALSKAFAGGGASLYDDKEEIAQRRAEEERRRKLEEEESLKKRKQQWEDDCVMLLAEDKEAIPFEDWDKQRAEREEAERKAAEEERKEAERRRKEEQRQAKLLAAAAKPKEESESHADDDDDELTEAELAMMRGYKKTADGRTTSYFTRELSEDEKKRIGDIAPKKIDGAAPQQRLPAPAASEAVRASGSAWNQAGTWVRANQQYSVLLLLLAVLFFAFQAKSLTIISTLLCFFAGGERYDDLVHRAAPKATGRDRSHHGQIRCRHHQDRRVDRGRFRGHCVGKEALHFRLPRQDPVRNQARRVGRRRGQRRGPIARHLQHAPRRDRRGL